MSCMPYADLKKAHPNDCCFCVGITRTQTTVLFSVHYSVDTGGIVFVEVPLVQLPFVWQPNALFEASHEFEAFSHFN